MKVLPVIFVIALSITSITSLPFPPENLFIFDAGANIARGIGSGINGVIDFNTGIAQGAIDTARDFAQTGIRIKSNIGKGITNGITGSIATGFDIFNNVSNSFINRISEAINRFTNRIITRAADQASAQLKAIQEKGSEVFANADQKLADLKQKLDSDIEAEHDKLTAWADKKVQQADDADVSQETKDQITEIADKVVQDWDENAAACGESQIEPMQNLNNEIRTTFEESLPAFEELTDKIRDCASGDQKSSTKSSNCAKEIRDKLSELSPLPRKYSQYLSRLNRIGINSFSRAACGVQTMGKAKRDQSEAEMKIKELILKDQESRNESTTASNDSETTASNDSETTASNDSKTTGASEGDLQTTSNAANPQTTENSAITTNSEASNESESAGSTTNSVDDSVSTTEVSSE